MVPVETGYRADRVELEAAASARPSRLFARATLLAAVSLLASLLVALGVQAFTGGLIRNHSAGLGWMEAVVSLVAAPAVENLILVFVLEACVAARMTDKRVLPLISAIPLSLCHAVFAPAWAVVVYPAFVVYAHAYDRYRRSGQDRTGYWMSVLVHAMHNGAALALVAIA
jgi:hypothetical protein